MKNPYEDMIDLPHHTSATRPRMSPYNRAAQFSPFAALSGYEEAIAETGRLTDQRIELDEYGKADLNERMAIIQANLKERPEITITYFQADPRKSGGTYVSGLGIVMKIDPHQRVLIMQDGVRIRIEDILRIEGELFKGLE